MTPAPATAPEALGDDYAFYNACALAALAALISKVPLADKAAGQDADGIGYEVCKSADRYAADMVRIRRERMQGGRPPGSATL